MIKLFLFLFTLQAWSLCHIKEIDLEIPSFENRSDKEFYFCLGFLHGRDRAFEMDFFRRSGEGLNAEVHGFSHLKSDLQMRLLNLLPLRDRLWTELSQSVKNKLIYYSEGVNQGFITGKKSPEFIEHDYEPRSWRPQDSILVLLLQSFDQTRKTFYRDYEEQLRLETIKGDVLKLFDESQAPWYTPIIKDSEVKVTRSFSSEIKKFFEATKIETVFGNESGSNNWVVDAKHTQSKFALFANDPHLDLKTPMFWYWIKTTDVFGATLPGVPVVISGTNGSVAWGLTNSYINTANAVEITDLKSSDVESFYPTVKIKWLGFKIPFFFKKFEKLKSGHPFLPLELPSGKKMVLDWTGFYLTGSGLESLFELSKSKNISEADDHLKKIDLPSWNFVFADQNGKIGYRTIGKVFKSKNELFGLVQKKSKDFYHPSFLDSTENPSLINPQKGFIVTANQTQWSKNYPLKFGGAYSLSFRGHRIEQLLSQDKKLTVQHMKNIQCDTYATDAKFLLPKLLAIKPVSELSTWNYEVRLDSKESAIYRRWVDLILEKTQFDEVALFHSLSNPNLILKKIISDTLFQAKKEINGRRWKDVLKVNFPHFIQDKNFQYSPEISGVGDKQTVNPGSAKWNNDKKIYEQFSGASMRLIVELSKPIKVWLSMPGRNIHYQFGSVKINPWQDWASCQYQEIKNFDK